MSTRVSTLHGLLAVSLVLIGLTRAEAELATKSPFMSATTPGAAAPTTGAPLEYRGMMETAQGLKARIVDPSRRTGVWLRVNERDPGFDAVVKSIDIEHDTVTIDYQGRPMTLAQHVAKVASAGAAQMPPPGGFNPAANMPAAIIDTVKVQPTPADEQRRLEAVASEVARRRQLREQASQQGAQSAQTAPQLTQPQPVQPQNNPAERGQPGNQRPRGGQP